MKFSVIITAQDRPEVLDEVIAALPDVAIIVAYRYIEPPSGVGLINCNNLPPTWQIGMMKNMGARLAMVLGFSHLIFLDGDCIPQEGYSMPKMQPVGFVEAYREAMATNWQIDTGPTPPLAIGRIDREEPDGTIKPDYRLSLPYEKRLAQGGGGNFCISAEAFDTGFDPVYDGGWGFEDSALFKRVIGQGSRYTFCDARVIHKHHDREPSHFEGLARNRRIYDLELQNTAA